MVWIRRVRRASGAPAVQIAESVGGRRRIVRHVGSARDEAELGLLIEQAQQLLADDTQGELDLGITPKAVRAHMVPQPAGALFTDGDGVPAARELVARPRVLKSCNGLLCDALAGIYASLGFDAVGGEVFRDLVIARVVEPTNLLDVDRVLAELGRTSATLSTRKRTLRRARAGDYRDQIAAACFAHARTAGDVSLVLYDVTTLYFEADKEDDLRRVGYSKERRVDPQIVVGLLVDRCGFPLEIGCFEGNKAETLPIVPIVKAFQACHEITDVVVVADAGMLASGSLRELDDAGLRFIVGSRVTKAPNDLASHFHWHGDVFTDGQVIDTITPRDQRGTSTKTNHDLWHVEASFRMSKSDLAARRVFARTRDAIEAHLTIVFTALAVSREAQNRTGLSLRHFLRTLKPLRSATIDLNGVIATFPPALDPKVKTVLDTLETGNSRH